jgi:UDP-2-acetamido-2-deoxy-ribo-hexuluronate aminotransferase
MRRVRLFDGRQSFARRWDDISCQVSRACQVGKFSDAAMTAELEEAIRRYTGARFAVAVNSGTDALYSALRAVSTGPGDEVIVPAISPASAASAVCQTGARPVIVDVQPDLYTIAPDAVRAHLTGRAKAILPVHPFARMADMAALRTIAEETDIVLVEDSRQAIGMRYQGTHAGLLGSAGALSFSPHKTLGALGDGGMVISNDEAVAERCVLLRHHGRTDENANRAAEVSSPAALIGVNSKMDEIQAAILLARLPWLDEAIGRRAELAARYTGHLAGTPGISTPVVVPPGGPADQVWHGYVIEARQRDSLADHLGRAGIETALPCPVPVHLQPAFRHLGGRRGDCPVAEEAAERMIGLPLHPDLTMADVDYVCQAVELFGRRSMT